MNETTFGPVLGLAAVAVFVVALDWAWRLLSEHVPGWMQSRDARTAARQTRTLQALGRIYDRWHR